MPIIHVYAYHDSRVPETAREDFLYQVREGLKFPMKEEDLWVECVTKGDNQMSLHRVSFRLPRRVATRARRKMRWEREDAGPVEGDEGSDAVEIEGEIESDSGEESEDMEHIKDVGKFSV